MQLTWLPGGSLSCWKRGILARTGNPQPGPWGSVGPKAVKAALENLGLTIQRGGERMRARRKTGRKRKLSLHILVLLSSAVTVADYFKPRNETGPLTLQLPVGALIHWLTRSPLPNFFLYLLLKPGLVKVLPMGNKCNCSMALLKKHLLLFSILFSVFLPLCAPVQPSCKHPIY